MNQSLPARVNIMGHLYWAAAALVLAQASWRQFSPGDGAFTVTMPAAPAEKKQLLEGNREARLYVCELKGKGVFVVSVTDFPESEGNAQRRLSNARDGAIDSVKGKLLYERKITLDSYPGRELWIEAERAGLIHTRIYAVKQRLYQTMAIGPKSFIETKETARFLDSFKVNK